MAPRKAPPKKKTPPRQPHGRNIRGTQLRPSKLALRAYEQTNLEAFRAMNSRKAAPERKYAGRVISTMQSNPDFFVSRAATRAGQDPSSR